MVEAGDGDAADVVVVQRSVERKKSEQSHIVSVGEKSNL